MRQRSEDKKRAGRLTAIDPYWISLTQTSIYDVSKIVKVIIKDVEFCARESSKRVN